MNKPLSLGIITAVFIVVVTLIIILSIQKRSDISSCSQDLECIVVDSIEGLQHIPLFYESCGCVSTAAINSDYLNLWEQKRKAFEDKLRCFIQCKPSVTKEFYTAKCINKRCILQQKEN